MPDSPPSSSSTSPKHNIAPSIVFRSPSYIRWMPCINVNPRVRHKSDKCESSSGTRKDDRRLGGVRDSTRKSYTQIVTHAIPSNKKIPTISPGEGEEKYPLFELPKLKREIGDSG